MSICPNYAPAFYNIAVVHSEGGRADEAVSQYKAALAVAPCYAEAWCNLGVIHKNQVRILELVCSQSTAGHCPAVFVARRDQTWHVLLVDVQT